METLRIRDLYLNQVIDFGKITLSEEEIIRFAKANDPLPFHVDKQVAERSVFKALVSSGPQIFNTFYLRQWVPRLGHTVICGLEINNWKFLAPVYAYQPISCIVTIIYLKKNEERGHAIVTCRFQFFNPDNVMVQTNDVTVMHKLEQ